MQSLATLRELLATPALLIGIVTLVGLLLQKKPFENVINGTVTAIVGFVILAAGSDYLQAGPLNDFGQIFNFAFNIQGVVPNMEAVSSLGIAKFASEVSVIMSLGMVANLIMARFSNFHYIFLTGHHTLYMACLLAVVFRGGGLDGWQMILSASLILGLLMAMMPALAEKEMVKVTGGDRIALGHFSTIGYLFAAGISHLVTRRSRKEGTIRSTEDINFPKKLSFMKNTTVSIFIVMTIIYLVITKIAIGQPGFRRLDISYISEDFQSWIIYSIVQGAKFSGAIYIVLAGVRLVIAEIVPAFKGIARKLVPNAKPAVDCPVLFNYAPNAAMIGFLMSFLGGILSMVGLIMMNSHIGWNRFAIIVPGVVAHFFCGGSAGVFANAEGGLKGCIVGSFAHGVLITFLALSVMPVLGALNLSGTTFSDADFCTVGILLGNLAGLFQEKTMCLICFIGLFLCPILWWTGDQMYQTKEKEQ